MRSFSNLMNLVSGQKCHLILVDSNLPLHYYTIEVYSCRAVMKLQQKLVIIIRVKQTGTRDLIQVTFLFVTLKQI